MRTAYIVFFDPKLSAASTAKMVFAFDTIAEAEGYIRRCIELAIETHGESPYTRENLYHRPVDFVNDLDKMDLVLELKKKRK